MGTAERRNEIMRVLCRRRHETVSNLASEFGVSERTILRDIEALSITQPIYTKCGKYDGGVYVTDNYQMERMYMSKKELGILHKVLSFAQEQKVCKLSEEEEKTLSFIISQYTRPDNERGNRNENTRKRAI